MCLNTVAVLFLCELDNVAFAVGLPEHIRSRVEKVGRVELAPADIEVIAWSKAVHMVLVVVFIFVWILTASAGPMSPAQVVGIQFLPFLLGGICDALRSPGATTAEKMRGVGVVIGLSFAGPIAYITIMLISVK